MHKDSPLPDNLLMEEWRNHPATAQIYKHLFSCLDPAAAFRSCALDKVGYYRGQGDALDYLKIIFNPKPR